MCFRACSRQHDKTQSLFAVRFHLYLTTRNMGAPPQLQYRELGVAPLCGAGLPTGSAIRLGAGPPYAPAARVGRHFAFANPAVHLTLDRRLTPQLSSSAFSMTDNAFGSSNEANSRDRQATSLSTVNFELLTSFPFTPPKSNHQQIPKFMPASRGYKFCVFVV